MEFIVQLFRALANRERIRVLRLITVCGETSVSQIAEAMQMPGNLISAHLKVLAAAGLVWRRRSGRTVGYHLAEHAGNLVTGAVLRMLPHTFSTVTDEDPKKIAANGQSGSPTRSDTALFAFFTAFTHPRRLQILRLLAQQRGAPLAELRTALSMSLSACIRHVTKLERRGLVAREMDDRKVTYVLKDVDGMVQKAVFRAVREHLAGVGQ